MRSTSVQRNLDPRCEDGWMHSTSTELPDAPKAPVDDTVRPPSLGLYLTEPARGALQLGALPFAAPWLARAPRGTPHGVLVLPGLMATDMSTVPIRRFLRKLGHTVWGWRLGRNLGPTQDILEGMPRALDLLADRTGSPVSVVGWSLGGIFARELARKHPDRVRQVITLGSPFALTDSRQSRADGAFRSRSHLHAPNWTPSWEKLARPIDAPSTAVYSRRDGIVHWRSCIAPESDRHQNVEVRCAHLGFGVDPSTLWLIADRLAQPIDARTPFRPPAMLRLLYPGSR
jgi:pimeloyl-ACP methyl ester carboxylesterase